MLHLLWNGAPAPVSPFLALMLLDGVDSFTYDKDFIDNLISPTVSRSLLEWHSLPENESFSSSHLPSAAALFDDVEANVSFLLQF